MYLPTSREVTITDSSPFSVRLMPPRTPTMSPLREQEACGKREQHTVRRCQHVVTTYESVSTMRPISTSFLCIPRTGGALPQASPSTAAALACPPAT